jgi:hypothetical protein
VRLDEDILILSFCATLDVDSSLRLGSFWKGDSAGGFLLVGFLPRETSVMVPGTLSDR